MKTKTLAIGIGLLLVAIFAGFFGSKFNTSPKNVGATSSFQQGNVEVNPMIFPNGLSVGSSQQFYVNASGVPYAQADITSGGILSTTTAASAALLASNLQNVTFISDLLTVGSATVTLPATSTLSTFLPNAGDSATVYIYNATSTAGQLLTLAFGTGWKGSIATSSAATTAVLNPQKGASLEITRLSTGDFMGLITPGV